MFNSTFDIYAEGKEWDCHCQWHYWKQKQYFNEKKYWKKQQPGKGLSDYQVLMIKGNKESFLGIFEECNEWSIIDETDLLKIFYLQELEEDSLCTTTKEGNLPLLIRKTDYLNKKRKKIWKMKKKKLNNFIFHL